MHRLLSLAFIASLSLLGFVSKAHALPATFRVMSYNAEDYFDATHDEGTEDYQYLPLSLKQKDPSVAEYCATLTGTYRQRCFNMDWSEEAFRNKARNLARVIKESGRETPDIIVLQEVENLNVLEKLVEWELANEGYREILLVEGPDPRGIDVGIISKFPLSKGTKYHQIDLKPVYPNGKVKLTRGILEATFDVHGADVTVMSNHWPSQNNPSAARVIAAQVMVKAVEDVLKDGRGYVISAGDFNTVAEDKPHGINEYLLNTKRSLQFWDLELVYFGEQLTGLSAPATAAPHRGTHFYKGHWSSLDKMFLAKSQNQDKGATRQVDVIWDSYRVFKAPFMLGKNGGPEAFNAETMKGYSDHLPFVVDFVVN